MERRGSFVANIAVLGMMIVLLFTVLSTATFAWYSASSAVSASDIYFTSSAIEGGILTIGKDIDPVQSSITFDAPDDLSPMIPITDGVKNVTALSEFLAFNRTYEELNVAGQWVAKLDGVEAQPTVLTVQGQEYFYIKNNSESELNITLSYDILGELKDKLLGAVFVGEEPVLAGIIGSEDDIHYGKISVGGAVDDMPVMENAFHRSGEKIFSVGAGENVVLRVIIWLDGVEMKDENGGNSTVFSLTFDVGGEE